MKIPSAGPSQRRFAEVPKIEMERSQIRRDSEWLGPMMAGYLYPIFADEIMPGDTFRIDISGFARLATQLKPLMDNLWFEWQAFFVPNRLLWDHWEDFIAPNSRPGGTGSYVTPKLELHAAWGDLIGMNIGILPASSSVQLQNIVAFYHRAYNKIFNAWYRAEDLVTPLVEHMDDGPDPMSSYDLRRRAKVHDYFTACLPWPQKGGAAVTIPTTVSGLASIYADGGTGSLGIPTFKSAGAGTALGATLQPTTTAAMSQLKGQAASGAFVANENLRWDVPHLVANVTGAMGTINQLRQAFAVQRILEAEARGGSRYVEVLKNIWKVDPGDSRLQRPEYLGGGSHPIVVSPIAQSSRSDPDESPQGNLAGVGTMNANSGFAKSFTEHGVLMILGSVRAQLRYQQGVNRMFWRSTRYDYPMPQTMHLSEQAVLNREIFATGSAADDAVFGYQEAFAELRYKPSIITGRLNSIDAQTLDIWHAAQEFGPVAPVLGPLFIEENPPLATRTNAVAGDVDLIANFFFKLTAARPIPLFGVPGYIDRF